jgi:hypothetical protein
MRSSHEIIKLCRSFCGSLMTTCDTPVTVNRISTNAHRKLQALNRLQWTSKKQDASIAGTRCGD